MSLDREQARKVLAHPPTSATGDRSWELWIDRLAQCVTPDPEVYEQAYEKGKRHGAGPTEYRARSAEAKLTAIEAWCNRMSDSTPHGVVTVESVLAILRGES